MEEILQWSASELSVRIHRREVSCVEVMVATLGRIERLNPYFNAIVNLAPAEVLLDQARGRDEELRIGESRGWMHGMPQAIKDLAAVSGFPTTLGSRLLRSSVAQQDCVIAARMKSAGCIVIGKTNTPELGLGSHTFNALFGATRNAWDPSVSAGGSSGGAAVALAQRLLPVADGSDFMGSLRNPAGWNHVFGLRPRQGRVPSGPGNDVWLSQLGTDGPMARTVADLAQLLAIQAGYDARLPLSLANNVDRELITGMLAQDTAALHGLRVGWLGNLDGYLAIEDGILDVCGAALERFESCGALVQPTQLGFDAETLWQSWLAWRRLLVAPRVAALLELPQCGRDRQLVKAEALWEFDHAQSLSATTLFEASQVRTRFYHHLLSLFEQFDVLALPVAQVWPFPLEQRWPTQIGGRAMDTYHRWMEVTIYATLGGLPALSLPAGFHPERAWPMGLQLLGRPQGEAHLLRVAAAYEAMSGSLLSQGPSAAPEAGT